MNEIIKSVASDLTNNNKYVNIPAGSALSIINPINVVEKNDMSGLDIRLANILSNEINMIRNDILPLIKEFGMFVTESLNKKLAVNPFKDVNIYTAELPEVFEELVARNVIKVNGDNTRTLSNSNLIIPTPTPAKIREYLVYGSGGIQEMIKSFTSFISDDELVRIWDTYLGRISADNTAYISLGYKVNSSIFGLDLFILSIIVKNLLTTIPEGVRVSNGMYQDTISTLDVVLDNKISRLITLINSNTNIGKVIYKADSLKEVIVIKSTYDDFLNKDGSPEIIYGAVLAGAKTAGVTTLVDNKDNYAKKWDEYVNSVTIKQKLSSLESHRLSYKLGVTDLINNSMTDRVKSMIPVEIVSKIDEVIINFLNNSKTEHLFNVNRVAEEIVAGILFGHTNAQEFIGYMKHYSKLNPDISPKEAATYASADLVVDYLISQLEIN